MKELQLIKSATFGDVQCDIYNKGDEFYMTREQVGAALDYGDPIRAIAKLHERHEDRLSRYSVVVKLTTTDGKAYDTTVYTRKGVMEICRHSQQPKADAFMDWTWEIMDSLMTGKAKLVDMTDYQRRNIETREQNIKIRKAQILSRTADKYRDTTPSYAQVIDSYVTKELTGEHLLPFPQLSEKTLTATEVGERLGITSHMVGVLTNRHNLKTDEYGAWFNDKAKGHSKEVPNFRYFENVIPVLRSIVEQQSA